MSKEENMKANENQEKVKKLGKIIENLDFAIGQEKEGVEKFYNLIPYWSSDRVPSQVVEETKTFIEEVKDKMLFEHISNDYAESLFKGLEEEVKKIKLN